jgi:hypothetical protein
MLEHPDYVVANQAVQLAQERVDAANKGLALAKQDLAAAKQRLADKRAARKEVADWAKSHGLPEPP